MPNNSFTEHRVGLDHLNFSVPSCADQEAAVKMFAENNIWRSNMQNLLAAFDDLHCDELLI